jgi:hypothetical protein
MTWFHFAVAFAEFLLCREFICRPLAQLLLSASCCNPFQGQAEAEYAASTWTHDKICTGSKKNT